ncbi:DUF2304 domain-containing protein [Solibacillus cecembensis]|uniref:DUF2304 domain-containing protein n=1 Tax=Solibacillus cecembensis TaxID=459347 RepID=UPI003CFDE9C5
MISVKLQLILLFITIVAIFQLVRMITRYKLDLKYALLWLLLGLLLLLFTVFPNIVYNIADFLTIETPTNALFLLGIFLILAIVFSLTISLSRASNKMKDLSQELGILKNEFESLRETIEKE